MAKNVSINIKDAKKKYKKMDQNNIQSIDEYMRKISGNDNKLRIDDRIKILSGIIIEIIRDNIQENPENPVNINGVIDTLKIKNRNNLDKKVKKEKDNENKLKIILFHSIFLTHGSIYDGILKEMFDKLSSSEKEVLARNIVNKLKFNDLLNNSIYKVNNNVNIPVEKLNRIISETKSLVNSIGNKGNNKSSEISKIITNIEKLVKKTTSLHENSIQLIEINNITQKITTIFKNEQVKKLLKNSFVVKTNSNNNEINAISKQTNSNNNEINAISKQINAISKKINSIT